MSLNMRKRILISLLAAVAVTISAVIYIYVKSNAIIYQKYDVPLVSLTMQKEASSIEAGKKIALTRGCHGCHTEDLSGKFYPDWDAGMVAANISKKIPDYSDQELFRLFRHGIKKDGTGLWGMPAGMFVNLADKDISHLIAHLRTVPPVEKELPTTAFNFKGRTNIVRGKIKPEVLVAREDVTPFTYPDNPTVIQQGKYLVLTTCTECHGHDFRGLFGCPPLLITKTYKEAEFLKLLKTGKALGERELPLMSLVSRGRFTHYSEDEMKAMYGFLMQL